MTDAPTHTPAEPCFVFLRRGDVIQAGDECPTDNCRDWVPVDRWAVGGTYNPGVLKIVRRPCHTPAQVAAAVQAERAAIAAIADAMVDGSHPVWLERDDEGDTLVSADVLDRLPLVIRARGQTSALDAALAAARIEGMEAAAVIAEADEAAHRGYVGCNPALIGPRIASAIRARIEEAKGEGA